MSLVDRFLKQLHARGLRVEGPQEGEPDDALRLKGETKNVTDELKAALKTFRPELVKRFGRKSEELQPKQSMPLPTVDKPSPDAMAECSKCGCEYAVALKEDVASMCDNAQCPLRSMK